MKFNHPTFTKKKELQSSKIKKPELAKKINLRFAFDFSLPQEWLNAFTEKSKLEYSLIRSTTFWVYNGLNNICGYPVSGCTEVQEELNKLYLK